MLRECRGVSSVQGKALERDPPAAAQAGCVRSCWFSDSAREQPCVKRSSGRWHCCRQQCWPRCGGAGVVAESSPRLRRPCLWPAVLLGFLTHADGSEAPGAGSSHFSSARQQPLPGNRTNFTCHNQRKFQARGFFETGGFDVAALMCKCRGAGVALQWGSSDLPC